MKFDPIAKPSSRGTHLHLPVPLVHLRVRLVQLPCLPLLRPDPPFLLLVTKLQQSRQFREPLVHVLERLLLVLRPPNLLGLHHLLLHDPLLELHPAGRVPVPQRLAS